MWFQKIFKGLAEHSVYRGYRKEFAESFFICEIRVICEKHFSWPHQTFFHRITLQRFIFKMKSKHEFSRH
jgi:hypothetical protein